MKISSLVPYFISRNVVIPKEGDMIDREKFIRTFKSKVIMYLFEDAARQKRSSLLKDALKIAPDILKFVKNLMKKESVF